MDSAFALNDGALGVVLVFAHMLLDHAHAFNQDALFAREDFQHLPAGTFEVPRNHFHLVALALFYWQGFLVEYLVLWVLPLVTVVQAILRLRAIAEHGATSDFSSPLTAARTNVAPMWLEWLIFPHHVNYHIEHHLYASVPHYNLRQLHREMVARGVLDGAEVVPFAVTLRKIFAASAASPASTN